MSAELLRRAAAKMRENASRTPAYGWRVKPHGLRSDCMTIQDARGSFLAYYCATGFADHAVSWSPDVAISVAHLLEAIAREFEHGDWTVESDVMPTWLHCELENVARTYLGEPS